MTYQPNIKRYMAAKWEKLSTPCSCGVIGSASGKYPVIIHIKISVQSVKYNWSNTGQTCFSLLCLMLGLSSFSKYKCSLWENGKHDERNFGQGLFSYLELCFKEI